MAGITSSHHLILEGFPVVVSMWELDHKEGRHWRIGAFELWCWRRLIRVPWTVRISNKSTLKEINSEYSLKGLKLKFQYFDYLMQTSDSLEKTLMRGEIESRRRRGQQRMRWFNSIMDKLQQMVKDREAWSAAVHRVAKELDTSWRVNNKNAAEVSAKPFQSSSEIRIE